MTVFHVTGNQLGNTALNITANGAPANTIDVSGITEMHPTTAYGDHITVNLAARSEWIGGFSLGPAHSFGKLEFMHSVSAGQTVTDSGYELYGGEFGVVQVDNPAQYHASNVLGFGEIILEGLRATSYSYKNDILSIFDGRSVIDTLKLAVQTINGSAPVAFGVSQVASSVVVHADGSSYHDGGTVLPVHP
jgi:hypothetical protein